MRNGGIGQAATLIALAAGMEADMNMRHAARAGMYLNGNQQHHSTPLDKGGKKRRAAGKRAAKARKKQRK